MSINGRFNAILNSCRNSRTVYSALMGWAACTDGHKEAVQALAHLDGGTEMVLEQGISASNHTTERRE